MTEFDEVYYEKLMDGLEAIEIDMRVCKDIIDFRIDASTYKKDYVRTDKILKALDISSIEEKMKSIQNFGAYSLCNDIVFTDDGIPFLMTQNIRHNYIDWNNIRYIDEASHNMLYKSHCKKGQVLVTMAGEYLGRVAVYDQDFICSSNQAIAKVDLQDGVSPYYVATFLNSRYGQNQINRFKTVTGQPNINMALIKSLMIPNLSDKIIKAVEKIVVSSNKMFQQANNSYHEAMNLCIKEIGIYNYKGTQGISSIKSFSDSLRNSGRLDAEYYQVEYDNYDRLLKQYYRGYGLIGDICTIKDKNYNPEHKVEYSYIELSDVGQQGDISECSKIYGSDLPTRARRKVSAGDVILSSVEGSLSKCALITYDCDGYLCTNGFYVVSCDAINPETLMILFKSRPIQALLKKGCSGTILSAIGKDELLKIPLPIIDITIQEKIRCMVIESNLARRQGKELLDKAIGLVETAIEQGEDVALKLYV